MVRRGSAIGFPADGITYHGLPDSPRTAGRQRTDRSPAGSDLRERSQDAHGLSSARGDLSPARTFLCRRAIGWVAPGLAAFLADPDRRGAGHPARPTGRRTPAPGPRHRPGAGPPWTE